MMELPHFNDDGHVHMVDVGNKPVTRRVAVASAKIQMKPETLIRIKQNDVSKGDVLELARIAGVMGCKRTPDLIPLCHPLMLDSVEMDVKTIDDSTIQVFATVSAQWKTGVEMEAMTAVSIACLTIYDMCKSIDRSMTITEIQLEEKSGGKSGQFVRKHS